MKRLLTLLITSILVSNCVLLDNISGTYIPYAYLSKNYDTEKITDKNCKLVIKSSGLYLYQGCNNIKGLYIGQYGIWKDLSIDYYCEFLYQTIDGTVYKELGSHEINREGKSMISFDININGIKKTLFFLKVSDKEDILINGKKDSEILSEFSGYL